MRLIALARQKPPSYAGFPPTKVEGAERRKALGCSGTRRRASNVGPQAPRFSRALCIPREQALSRPRLRGCSPLGAPPRDLWLRSRANVRSLATPKICELLASARSGG